MTVANLIDQLMRGVDWQSNLDEMTRRIFFNAASMCLIECEKNNGDLQAEFERQKRVLSYVNWCYGKTDCGQPKVSQTDTG